MHPNFPINGEEHSCPNEENMGLLPQLFENQIALFTGQLTIQCSQCILFDGIGDISAQANDSYTFTFVLYKIHMAILSFPTYFIY